jgi:hypothetical protein
MIGCWPVHFPDSSDKKLKSSGGFFFFARRHKLRKFFLGILGALEM